MNVTQSVTHCIFSTFRVFILLSPQSYFYVSGFKRTGSPNLLVIFCTETHC